MDIIREAAEALKEISDSGITVMQGWYDEDINNCHITLWDLGDYDMEHSEDEPENGIYTVQVTIFSREDEIDLVKKIKKLMLSKGFFYEGRNADDSKPEEGIYMKAQRFSKIYNETEE